MKNSISLTISALSALLISACIEPISLSKLPSYTERITLNSRLSNTDVITLELSQSTNAYMLNSPSLLENASIVFKEDGIEKAVTYNLFSKKYESAITAKPGSRYTVTASHTNFPIISAEAVMPSLIVNKNVKLVINGGLDQTGTLSDLISVTWKDPAGVSNYYKIDFKYYSQTLGQFVAFDYEVGDPVLTSGETLKLNDGSFIFNDLLFDGKSKTLSAVAPFGLVSPGSDYKYLIELSNLSEAYYKYVATLQRYRDSQDFDQGLLDEPVVVFTNINNGLGIFAGMTIEKDTLR
jgi:hypothetical protein